MANTKKRVDILLFERGMVESRTKAQALIMAGLVFTKDRRIQKAGESYLKPLNLSLKIKNILGYRVVV